MNDSFRTGIGRSDHLVIERIDERRIHERIQLVLGEVLLENVLLRELVDLALHLHAAGHGWKVAKAKVVNRRRSIARDDHF